MINETKCKRCEIYKKESEIAISDKFRFMKMLEDMYCDFLELKRAVGMADKNFHKEYNEFLTEVEKGGYKND